MLGRCICHNGPRQHRKNIENLKKCCQAKNSRHVQDDNFKIEFHEKLLSTIFNCK